jgi:hypothetical protein
LNAQGSNARKFDGFARQQLTGDRLKDRALGEVAAGVLSDKIAAVRLADVDGGGLTDIWILYPIRLIPYPPTDVTFTAQASSRAINGHDRPANSITCARGENVTFSSDDFVLTEHARNVRSDRSSLAVKLDLPLIGELGVSRGRHQLPPDWPRKVDAFAPNAARSQTRPWRAFRLLRLPSM